MRTRYILEWKSSRSLIEDCYVDLDGLINAHQNIFDLEIVSDIHAYEIKNGQISEMVQWQFKSPKSRTVNPSYSRLLTYIKENDINVCEIHKRIADGMDWIRIKGDELEALKKEALGITEFND